MDIDDITPPCSPSPGVKPIENGRRSSIAQEQYEGYQEEENNVKLFTDGLVAIHTRTTAEALAYHCLMNKHSLSQNKEARKLLEAHMTELRKEIEAEFREKQGMMKCWGRAWCKVWPIGREEVKLERLAFFLHEGKRLAREWRRGKEREIRRKIRMLSMERCVKRMVMRRALFEKARRKRKLVRRMAQLEEDDSDEEP